MNRFRRGEAADPGLRFEAARPATCYRSDMLRCPSNYPAVAALLIAMLITAGCGYRSQLSGPGSDRFGSESSLGQDSAEPRRSSPTRIAVLALRNDSPEPWLDRILTEAMRRELSARGAFDFVNDPNRAELVLRGRIRSLDTRSRSFSRFVAALEYGLTLAVDLELVRSKGEIVRLDSRILSESDVYLASPDIEVTRTNRLEVLRRLADVLASRVADSIELIERPIPKDAEGGAG